MKVLSTHSGDVTLQLSREEVALLNNALNETLEALEEWELGTRLGAPREAVERLLEELGRLNQA